MAKLRSYFASDLDYLKASITVILAKNAEGLVEPSDILKLSQRLESVSLALTNRHFSDLIRKK